MSLRLAAAISAACPTYISLCLGSKQYDVAVDILCRAFAGNFYVPFQHLGDMGTLLPIALPHTPLDLFLTLGDIPFVGSQPCPSEITFSTPYRVGGKTVCDSFTHSEQHSSCHRACP